MSNSDKLFPLQQLAEVLGITPKHRPWTPDEVADLLQCKKSLLAAKRCHGERPHFIKLNRIVRYPEIELFQWMVDQYQGSRNRDPEEWF